MAISLKFITWERNPHRNAHFEKMKIIKQLQKRVIKIDDSKIQPDVPSLLSLFLESHEKLSLFHVARRKDFLILTFTEA